MDSSVLIPLIAAVTGLVCLGVLVFALMSNQKSDFRNLMASGKNLSSTDELKERLGEDQSGEELDQINQLVRRSTKKKRKKKTETLEEQLFKAGLFSEQHKKDFKRLQVVAPTVAGGILGACGLFLGDFTLVLMLAMVGVIGGFYVPFKMLSKKIANRDEEILFHLPLVIEQISIGVSSSLDVGPCLARIVQVASERDTHNPVTELLLYSQYFVKSGVTLEEALTEVGRLSGHAELKHAFMALSQVAKFGGEVTRQLQELADAVATQRETKVEARIKKLELAATAPVALVFFGYLIILLVGFGLQIISSM